MKQLRDSVVNAFALAIKDNPSDPGELIAFLRTIEDGQIVLKTSLFDLLTKTTLEDLLTLVEKSKNET